MRAVSKIGLGGVVAVVALVFVREARACQGPLARMCRGARVEAGPANTQVLTFWSVFDTKGAFKAPAVRITDAEGAEVPSTTTADPNVPPRWIVKLEGPLAEGATYDVAWDPLCTADEIALASSYGRVDPTRAEVTVPPSASAPAALGTVKVTMGPEPYTHGPNSCDAVEIMKEFEAVVAQVALDVDPSFVPHRGIADIRLTVDGVVPEELRPGNTSNATRMRAGSIGDALMASCDPTVDTGISPAPHRIGFRAFVTGIDTPFEADTVVDFTCPPVDEVPASPGAASPPSAQPSSSPPALPASAAVGSGCSALCRTETGRASAGPVTLVLGIVLARRRRAASS